MGTVSDRGLAFHTKQSQDFIHMKIKLIFIWKDEHQDSVSEKEAKGNSEMAYYKIEVDGL